MVALRRHVEGCPPLLLCPQSLLVTSVRSRRQSYHSQADSAGSIPPPSPQAKKCCCRLGNVASNSLLTRVFGPRQGHLGLHSHLDTHHSLQEGAQFGRPRAMQPSVQHRIWERICELAHNDNAHGRAGESSAGKINQESARSALRRPAIPLAVIRVLEKEKTVPFWAYENSTRTFPPLALT